MNLSRHSSIHYATSFEPYNLFSLLGLAFGTLYDSVGQCATLAHNIPLSVMTAPVTLACTQVDTVSHCGSFAGIYCA